MNNIDMLVDQLIAKEQPTIVQVSTNKLHPFPSHPFKVQDDEDMEQLSKFSLINQQIGSIWHTILQNIYENKNRVSTTVKSVMNTRYGAGDRTRTCTSKTEEPKSTESTNSTTPAYSVDS